MRTERTTRRSRCCRTFLHVRRIKLGEVAASDRAWERPGAPVLLPESDTASLCNRLRSMEKLTHSAMLVRCPDLYGGQRSP